MKLRAAAAAALLAAASPPPPADGLLLGGAAVQGGLMRGTAPAGSQVTLDGEAVPISPEGRFFIGFDRDHSASARLEARLPDGRTLSRSLAVAPRQWPIQRLGIARRPGGPTAEYLRLREGELARIAAGRARDTGAEGWRQRFAWPARGRISGVFGSQRYYRGEPASFHSGVDVAAGAGAAVTAPADAVVVLAGPPAFSLEGNLVILDHGLGLNSAFLHLSSVAVREGQKVRQGELVGRVGATGRTTGPHLHWSVRWRGARIDPAPLAGPMTR